MHVYVLVEIVPGHVIGNCFLTSGWPQTAPPFACAPIRPPACAGLTLTSTIAMEGLSRDRLLTKHRRTYMNNASACALAHRPGVGGLAQLDLLFPYQTRAWQGHICKTKTDGQRYLSPLPSTSSTPGGFSKQSLHGTHAHSLLFPPSRSAKALG